VGQLEVEIVGTGHDLIDALTIHSMQKAQVAKAIMGLTMTKNAIEKPRQ
jgi:hypothetical protein